MPLDPEQALSMVGRLYAELSNRRPDAEKADKYYRGAQPLVYASKEWATFHADRYKGFSDNWCGVVGNSPAERLRVDGFRLDADAEPSTDERELWNAWLLNDMEAQSSQGFLASTIAARSAVLVWGDEDDEPVFTWEDATQMVVGYEPGTRRRTAALKSWLDGDVEYATLYTADEVWKFQRAHGGDSQSGLYVADQHGQVIGTTTYRSGQAGGWERREVEGEQWPVTHDLADVPVVEFPNRPMLGNRPLSEIAGTMAMQDAVNMLWAYLFTAADFASMPARVVMGLEPPMQPILDENGQKVGDKPVELRDLAQGRLLWLTGQGGSIGQWDAAKLDVFTDAVEIAVGHIAAQTRTPQHYLVGKMANLSADALKAAETGLVKKVEEQQLFFGPAVREVFRLAALVRGQRDLAKQCRLGRVLWKDAENRSDAQRADALLKKRQIGYPLAYLLEQDGLNPTEVARVLDMVEAERDDPLTAELLRPVTAPGSQAPVAEDAAGS